jgi:hypothetical protein
VANGPNRPPQLMWTRARFYWNLTLAASPGIAGNPADILSDFDH